MTYREILEACWTGYRQAGMKNKGGRQVPNCVPVREAEIEENLRDWCQRIRVRRQAQVFAPGQGTCTGQERSCVSSGSQAQTRSQPQPYRKGHQRGH
jgi:hypothetical protein